MCFFLAPPLVVVVDFFVTFVDVLAKDDVDFVLGAVAFGLVWAAGGAAGAAGFLVDSTFYLFLI